MGIIFNIIFNKNDFIFFLYMQFSFRFSIYSYFYVFYNFIEFWILVSFHIFKYVQVFNLKQLEVMKNKMKKNIEKKTVHL